MSERALRSHQWKVHTEDGINHRPAQGTKPWNYGLTSDNDYRVKLGAQNLSKTIKKKVDDGTFQVNRAGLIARMQTSKRQSEQNSGGKAKWFTVAGKKVQGTWERDFAKRLEDQHIAWRRCESLIYTSDGIEKRYTPDFYLPERNLYVEIKGYWWGNDRHKMDLVLEQHSDKKFIIIEKYEDLINFK